MCEQPKNPYEDFLQKLPCDWERLEIRKLGTVAGGGTPSREIPSYWNGDIPWVTPGEISNTQTQLLHCTQEHISHAGLIGSGANLLPAGSLMVTTRATLGARAINAVSMATNQGFKSIIFKNLADGGYYFHLFEKVKPELVRRASGTTFLEISGAEFGSIEVPNPPISEKKLIAQVLDTLDTAICETEVLIDKLKAVKLGLLHDLLTRGIDSNGQLRPPQSQAPELYKASPLGWIPKEWNWDTLDHWLTGKPKNGYSPKEAGEWTGIQMLGLGCLTKEGFLPTQLKPAPAADKGLDRARLNEGDLLVSRANTRELVGLVGVYRDVGTPCTYPDLMMRLLPSEETSAEFLELVLQSKKVRRQVQAAASGTSESMVKISSSVVTSLKVAIPKTNEQTVILCRTKTLNAQLQRELQGLEVLRAVKVGLMDDLLSGRVRVTPLLESIQQADAQTEA
jgi:type I restriction enzyme S subunit